jgi:pimeloyl-ACP methyl ester carboxylesterase
MNGAFRRFDLLKSSHPIRIQFKTFKQFKAITESMGGTVDPKFEQLYPHLKTIYQQVILSSLKNSLKRNLKTKTRPISISADIQVIGSENDPFIPKSSIHSLHSDLPNSVLVWKSFGHFPYSHFSKMDIRKTILEFESET